MVTQDLLATDRKTCSTERVAKRTPLNQRLARAGFYVSPEKLMKQHLLRKGGYARLKALLPIPVLVLVWLRAIHLRFPADIAALSNSTITLRHLVLAFGIALLWGRSTRRTPRQRRSGRAVLKREFFLLFRSSFLCGVLLSLGHVSHSSVLRSSELGISLTLAFLVGSLLLLFSAYLISAQIMPYPSRSRKAIIVGSGPRASALRKLAQASHYRLKIVGCLDDQYVGHDGAGDGYLGDLSVLPEFLKAHPVDLVLIGLPVKSHYEQIQKVIAVCESVGVDSQYMLDVFATTRNSQQNSPAPSELAVLGDPPNDLRHWIKRGLDLLVTISMLLVLFPALVAIAIAIKFTSPGPVFFVQQRYGQNRERFPMFKFRTMVVDAEQRQAALEKENEAAGPVFKMKSDPRVTRVGALLRRTSLDELPQLFNILRGEMTLVGPRPLPLRDVSRFNETRLLRRFSVRPGLTCLWQVRGRSNTTFDQWISLDLEYIDSWTLGLDLKILAETIPAVLRGSGAM